MRPGGPPRPRTVFWDLPLFAEALLLPPQPPELLPLVGRDAIRALPRVTVGLLYYVDGHVRPYHGTTHTLPEGSVTRRRLCMPATTDIWVNPGDAQPLFVVTAPANDDLLAVLRTAIPLAARRLVGERRVMLTFDRAVHPHGFDVHTSIGAGPTHHGTRRPSRRSRAWSTAAP